MLATGRVRQGIRTRGTWDNEPGPQNRDTLVLPTGDQGVKCSVLFPLLCWHVLGDVCWLCSLITNLLRMKRNGNKSLAQVCADGFRFLTQVFPSSFFFLLWPYSLWHLLLTMERRLHISQALCETLWHVCPPLILKTISRIRFWVVSLF